MIAMESPGTFASRIHLGICFSKSLIRVSQRVVSSRLADFGCLFRSGRISSGRSEKLKAARPLSTKNSLRLIRSDIALAFQPSDSRLIPTFILSRRQELPARDRICLVGCQVVCSGKGMSSPSRSINVLVRHQRHKFGKLGAGGDLLEQRCRQLELSRFKPGLAPKLLQLFSDSLPDHFRSDTAAVIQPRPMPDPLPDLRATDFGRRGVFHQVVDRDAALSRAARIPDTECRHQY